MKINYIEGDLFALLPENETHIFIPHIVNNIGRWGSGFVVPLGKKWPEAEAAYRSQPKLELGDVDFVKVREEDGNLGNIWVCNMVGQNGVVGPDNPKPIKYSALVRAMNEVGKAARGFRHRTAYGDVAIHAPKFGSERACGKWDHIEELIYELWDDIDVTIYEYKE
jgi:hypothetical protein